VVTENNDTTHPRAIERWLEGNLPGYRFGVVLTLLLTTFVFMASAPTGAWTRAVTVGLQGLTLLAALRASQVSRRLFRVAALVVAIAFLSSLGSLAISTSTEVSGAFDIVSVLMVGVAPIAIARALWRRPDIDTHTVLGAICIYVLVGMLFAFVDSAIGVLGSGPFFVQTNHASTADYLYFSFVTITTVGYGDFTAAGGLGRALASLEALLGQVYLVTVVATIVGGMNRARRERVPSD
jgi:Ion channel